MAKALQARRGAKITQTDDEVGCPVAPLAREYAAIIRARRALDSKAGEVTDQGKALLALTDPTGETELGPLSAEYADKLLLARYEGIEKRARNLIATSRIGVAFQMLLIHTDDLENHLPSAEWNSGSKQLRDLSARLDSERAPIIWNAYRHLTRGMHDRDLETLESLLGRDGLTDVECVTAILAAA